jgi:hypothetical protein
MTDANLFKEMVYLCYLLLQLCKYQMLIKNDANRKAEFLNSTLKLNLNDIELWCMIKT